MPLSNAQMRGEEVPAEPDTQPYEPVETEPYRPVELAPNQAQHRYMLSIAEGINRCADALELIASKP